MPSKTILFGNGHQKLFEVFWTNPVVKHGIYHIQYMTYSYDIFPYSVRLSLFLKNVVVLQQSFKVIPQELQFWSYTNTFISAPASDINFVVKILST